jgi:release factor glutamine methyltransferase
VREVARVLEHAGVPSAEHDARVLVRYAADSGVPVDELVEARSHRVPLQHLTGTAGFRYLDLQVGPGVFVPRPETELLVDAVLETLQTDADDLAVPVVVDLCAGSGAIGLSVAHEHPRVVVHLVEQSGEAFSWLARNAQGRDRIHLHHADLAGTPAQLDGSVDVVVSNPPYLPLDERDLVDPEVRDYDPPEALWAGEDGLAVVGRVVAHSVRLLRPGGRLVVEHSERQDVTVPALFAEAGFVDVHVHEDLTGRPRFSVGTRPC